MDLGLVGRVAFITGGSRGIGRACGLAFAREGARVAFSYHSDHAVAGETAAAISRAGGQGLAVPLDLRDPESMATAVRSVSQRWGGILGWRHLPRAERLHRGQRPDLGGPVLLAAALALLIFALLRGQDDGWASVPAAMFAGSAIALGAFLLAERRHPGPMLDARLFRETGGEAGDEHRMAGLHFCFGERRVT